MNDELPNPVERLAELLAEMQRIQALIAADGQPLSMHEVDALKRLGIEYSQLVASLEASEQQKA